MPNIIEINDFSAPELDVYARLSEAQLLVCSYYTKWVLKPPPWQIVTIPLRFRCHIM